MASHKSAIKANRQATKHRLQNRTHRSKLRGQVKKLRAVLGSGEAQGAGDLLKATLSLVDRSVKHGVIHKNAAARTKSRLTRALARLAAASS